MTKSWGSIREEACRLYAQGKSLTEVRSLLKERRGFDASIRAYRLKFKQWDVKRARHSKVLSNDSHDACGTASGCGVPSGRTDYESLPLAVTGKHTENGGPSALSAMPSDHVRPHVSHACSCCEGKLELYLQEFVRGVTPHGVTSPCWLAVHFSEPLKDNILHLLIRDAKWRHLDTYAEALKHLMYSTNDELDCDGLTALGLSIRTSNISAMEVLLESKPSRWHSMNPYELHNELWQLNPLELAFAESADLSFIAAMMDRGFELDRFTPETILRTDVPWLGDKLLARLSSVLRSSGTFKELEDAYYIIEQVVKCKAHPHILGMLLQNWRYRRLSRNKNRGREWAPVCLAELLNSQIDFWSLDSGMYWERNRVGKCHCSSAAEFAIFHVCDEVVVDATLARSNGYDMKRLIWAVIAPCRERLNECTGPYLCNLLRRAQEHVNTLDMGTIVTTMMAFTPEEFKPGYWLILVGSRIIPIRESGRHLEDTIADISVKSPQSSSWTLAELVFPRDPGYPSSSGNRVNSVLFCPDPDISYLEYLTPKYLDHLCHWLDPDCQACEMMLVGLFGRDWTQARSCGCYQYHNGDDDAGSEVMLRFYDRHTIAQRARWLQRCVLHVITQDMCRQTSLFGKDMPLKERIQSALRIRQEYHLTDLPIEMDVLAQVLPPITDAHDDIETLRQWTHPMIRS